ncbi:MAG: hypothetical protein ACKVOL_11780 [Novosphingobium sp.]
MMDQQQADSTSVAATGPDAAIHAAWPRRVAVHRTIAEQGMDASDRSADPHWAAIDECDKFIMPTVAKTPRGVETQIWLALHNSSAYLAVEEDALLRMDLAYVEKHERQFEWAALPMVWATQGPQSRLCLGVRSGADRSPYAGDS